MGLFVSAASRSADLWNEPSSILSLNSEASTRNGNKADPEWHILKPQALNRKPNET